MPCLVLVLLLVALGLGACGGDDDDADGAGETAVTGSCEQVEAPATREPETLEPPGEPLEEGTEYRVVMETSCGSFTITLDPGTSPKAAASFAALAESGYFDDTTFHRIVPDFVIQGGDPTATGAGGPGYTTVDPPPSTTSYTRGTVAMAKAEAEPAGAAGSQFFVMTADAPMLSPDYAVVGRVTEGLDAVQRIGELGDASQQPTQPVVVRSAELEEG